MIHNNNNYDKTETMVIYRPLALTLTVSFDDVGGDKQVGSGSRAEHQIELTQTDVVESHRHFLIPPRPLTTPTTTSAATPTLQLH